MSNENILEVAKKIFDSKVCVALTGAGMSVESGIPDFRSKGGLWEKFDPMEYATITAFIENPYKVWEMIKEMESVVSGALPNPGHFGLAHLEEMGYLKAIITQNIDNLHQKAGNRNVIEFHGNGNRLVCIKCKKKFKREEVARNRFPPVCNLCNSILKPDVVLFGEPIPEQALRESISTVERCDLMLIIGTSAQVAPASLLPIIAKRNRASIIEINLERTDLSFTISDIFIKDSVGRAIPLIVREVDRLKNI